MIGENAFVTDAWLSVVIKEKLNVFFFLTNEGKTNGISRRSSSPHWPVEGRENQSNPTQSFEAEVFSLSPDV